MIKDFCQQICKIFVGIWKQNNQIKRKNNKKGKEFY